MTTVDIGQVPTCSKRYPCHFQPGTLIQEQGYSLYRQQDTGQSFTITVPNASPGVTARIENRRVVQYSLFLYLQYKAHINVEICSSIRAVKNIHKHIYKGGDKGTAVIEREANEIERYMDDM